MVFVVVGEVAANTCFINHLRSIELTPFVMLDAAFVNGIGIDRADPYQDCRQHLVGAFVELECALSYGMIL